MGLQETTARMYNEGLRYERIVMDLTRENFRCNVFEATKWEDTNQHIDFWCESNGRKYGIDVKGPRKNKRDDKDYDDTINWIELANVQGNKGWIYGDAAYIAFVTKKSVLFVPRKEIARMVEEKILGKETVHSVPSMCYVPYQRMGRLDKIVKVPTEDLRKIARHEISL